MQDDITADFEEHYKLKYVEGSSIEEFYKGIRAKIQARIAIKPYLGIPRVQAYIAIRNLPDSDKYTNWTRSIGGRLLWNCVGRTSALVVQGREVVTLDLIQRKMEYDIMMNQLLVDFETKLEKGTCGKIYIEYSRPKGEIPEKVLDSQGIIEKVIEEINKKPIEKDGEDNEKDNVDGDEKEPEQDKTVNDEPIDEDMPPLEEARDDDDPEEGNESDPEEEDDPNEVDPEEELVGENVKKSPKEKMIYLNTEDDVLNALLTHVKPKRKIARPDYNLGDENHNSDGEEVDYGAKRLRAN